MVAKPQNPVRKISDWNNRINYNNINMSSIYGLEQEPFWFLQTSRAWCSPILLPSQFNESTYPKCRVIIID